MQRFTVSLPTVRIIMTTYAPNSDIGQSREFSALTALCSWRDELKYDGDIVLHIADDGSSLPRFPTTLADASIWPVEITQQKAHGVGASLNQGVTRILHEDEIALHMVDDWALTKQYDITPWVNLLVHEKTVGMVRLGPPHPWLKGKIEAFTDGWGLIVERHHFAFGLRPCLWHPRFFDAYGFFDEDQNSYECERLYNERFCKTPVGPEIVLALPDPWLPVGYAEVGDIDPRMRTDG